VKFGWQGHARLGSWGPGRGPFWGEYRSEGTGGSHPGIKVPDLPPGARPISHNPGHSLNHLIYSVHLHVHAHTVVLKKLPYQSAKA